jgi:hypothetical protein
MNISPKNSHVKTIATVIDVWPPKSDYIIRAETYRLFGPS